MNVNVISEDREFFERLALAISVSGIGVTLLAPGTSAPEGLTLWDAESLGDPPEGCVHDGRFCGTESESRDEIYKYGTLKEITEAIRRMGKKAARRGGCRCVLFFSFAGGSGATTCASGFAAAAASAGEEVLLINAESCSPGRDDAEGTEETFSDLIFALSRGIAGDLSRFAVRGDDGVFRFPAPLCERDRVLFDAEMLDGIIGGAGSGGRFSLTVIDASFSFAGLCGRAIERCGEIFAVSGTGVTALRKLKSGLSALDAQARAKIRVVLNRVAEVNEAAVPEDVVPVLSMPDFGRTDPEAAAEGAAAVFSKAMRDCFFI